MTKNQPTMTNFKKLTDIDTLFQMLQSAGQTLDLSLTDKTLWQLLAYLDNLLLWNKAYNLTAITQPKDALIKHIIDCLAIVGHFERALWTTIQKRFWILVQGQAYRLLYYRWLDQIGK